MDSIYSKCSFMLVEEYTSILRTYVGCMYIGQPLRFLCEGNKRKGRDMKKKENERTGKEME